ncbi:MAG: glycosyltransferase [Saprospiraceae bacterium]|nr:glycosyltransferase [Saprospiraceae bacterium]
MSSHVLTLSVLPLLLSLLYCGVIVRFLFRWRKVDGKVEAMEDPKLSASIVVAARNEEDHILACVQSCLQQSNPFGALEVIVVDDQSEDDTCGMLEAIDDARFSLMQLGVYRRTTIKGSKKKAIAYGVQHAHGDIILTTDADCIVPEGWVHGMLEHFRDPGVHLVCGPVRIAAPNGLLGFFQALDLTANGLVNATGLAYGSHDLCSGANLAYRRDAFLQADAYEHNYDVASGDDVFLLRRMRELYPKGLRFAHQPSLMVDTRAVEGWASLMQQRLRWAGKLRWMGLNRIFVLAAFVWLQRASWLAGLTAGMITMHRPLIFGSLAAMLLQLATDTLLQSNATKFFQLRGWQAYLVPVWFLHNLYFIGTGLSALLPVSTKWKGRPS